MTVWVDSLIEYQPGTVKGAARVKYWCHMFSDTEAELHEMADKIGMRRVWFQPFPAHSLPHYDLSQTRRILAVSHGAKEWITPFRLEDFRRFRWGQTRTSNISELSQ